VIHVSWGLGFWWGWFRFVFNGGREDKSPQEQ